MKNKFYLLSTIISSCIFTIACNQTTADELHPNMPTNTRRPCYSSTKCTGNPNVIGGPRSYEAGPNQGYNTQAGSNGNPSNGYSNQYNYNNNGFNSGYSSNFNSYDTQEAQNGEQAKMLQTESTEKFSGTVKTINRVKLPDQTQLQMVLTTDQGEMLVILGPASFLDQSKIKFNSGDKVVVTGYRVKGNGQVVIMAAKVQRNGNTLELLNAQRQPLWGRQRY